MVAIKRRMLAGSVAIPLLALIGGVGAVGGVAAQGLPQTAAAPCQGANPPAWCQQQNGQNGQHDHRQHDDHHVLPSFISPVVPVVVPYVPPVAAAIAPPIPPTPPPAPLYSAVSNTLATPTNVQGYPSAGGLSFTWDAMPGADGYWVYSPAATPAEQAVGAPGITLNGLPTGSSVCITVLAYSSAGFSSWSSWGCATVTGSPAYSTTGYASTYGTTGSCQQGYVMSASGCMPPSPPTTYP